MSHTKSGSSGKSAIICGKDKKCTNPSPLAKSVSPRSNLTMTKRIVSFTHNSQIYDRVICHSRWILLFRFLITGFLVTIIFQSYAQQRITVNLQSNWRFSRDRIIPRIWRILMIQNGQLSPSPMTGLSPDPLSLKAMAIQVSSWKGEGWYRYPLEIPKSFSGKRIYLLFWWHHGISTSLCQWCISRLMGLWIQLFLSRHHRSSAYQSEESTCCACRHTSAR